MMETGDDTAAIDLAITFFCAVLVLFVFVEFNVDNDPRPEVPVTLGQSETTRELTPPAWSAVNERGSFAVLTETDLAVLDLPALAAGVLDPAAAFQGPEGTTLFNTGPGAAPNDFSLTFGFAPDDLPAPWTRERLTLAADAACPETARALVTVLVPAATPDLEPLGAYARRCGFRLRLETLAPPMPDGFVWRRLALSAEHYTAESMFR